MQKLTGFVIEFLVFIAIFVLVTQLIARSEMAVTEAILVFALYKLFHLIWTRFGPQANDNRKL